MAVALTILPIVLTLVCGYFLVVTHILPRDQWGGIETLSYRLLIPAVLIKSIAATELSLSKFGSMLMALVLTLVLTGLLVLGFRWWQTQDKLPNPAFTTLFQPTTRWNVFIALAAAELFIGPHGVALIALSMAVLVPLINIINVMVLAFFGPAPARGLPIASMILKNPLLQACAIGIVINLSGISLPTFALQTLELIAGAALGVGILAIGAGVSAERLIQRSSALGFGVIFRMVLGPAIFLSVAAGLGLGQTEVMTGIVIMAVPTASDGYILAEKMGGDAALYADILAWQTILSMLTLPLLILFLTATWG